MRTVALLGFIVTFGVLNQGPLTARQVAAGGVISGVLLDAVTGLPIGGATAELWPADDRPMPPRGTPSVTDDQGRFEFRDLAAGQYQVEAGDPDRRYLAGSWGKAAPFDHCCRKVLLKSGERLTGLDIRLWPSAAIGGSVTDDRGEPIIDVAVTILKRDYMDGRLTWVHEGLARTDDRGRFTSGTGMHPGEYLVVLSANQPPSKTPRPNFDTVYFGGARRASQAAAVRLAIGERRTDLDLRATLRPDPRLFSVAGRVMANGDALQGVTVELVPRDTDDAVAHVDGFRTQSGPLGAFSFSRIPEGEYALRAWQFPMGRGNRAQRSGPSGGFGSFRDEFPQPLADNPTWIAEQLLTLTGSVANLDVPMQVAPRIRGRVAVAGQSTPPSSEILARTQLNVLTTHGRDLGLVPVAGFDPTGQFYSVGLPPGEYLLKPMVAVTRALAKSGALRGLPYYSLVSVTVEGRETIHEAVELGSRDVDVVLTLTNEFWELSGVVRDAAGRVVPGGRVVVFPQDRARWQRVAYGNGQVYRASADDSGVFRLPGVIPGNYFVAAVSGPTEFWMAPEYLETLVPLATLVPLEVGEKRTVELRLR